MRGELGNLWGMNFPQLPETGVIAEPISFAAKITSTALSPF